MRGDRPAKPPKRTPAPAPSDDDVRMFHEAIGPVRPVASADVAPSPPGPAPEARQFALDEARVRDELLDYAFDPAEIEVGEEISFLRDGFAPRLLKRLKRGQFSVQDEFDLHQMTADVARTAIVEFLAASRRRGLGCVKLIHGKGLRSRPGGPVIKRLVDRMLRQRDDIVAFASARANQGGTGATLVLLRTS
jgi:DNA-nicking Smr family endonuclease